MNENDRNIDAGIILSLAILAATIVLGTVYFGLSRLLHEYAMTFLFAIICSFTVLKSFREMLTDIGESHSHRSRD